MRVLVNLFTSLLTSVRLFTSLLTPIILTCKSIVDINIFLQLYGKQDEVSLDSGNPIGFLFLITKA